MSAALASASNELTIAAANFNIDFSLIKIDAPIEFQDLGNELSMKRKTDAETGSSHVTARRLGALFEGILPKTPKLFEAYGLRASEITKCPDINPKGGEKDGIFASQTGVDATTIWAAATSGSSAIGVHLLACMLARIWTPSEATSIWVQIIEGRRQEIATGFESGGEMRWQTFNAARPELTRKQVAEWDASARAWLRAADQAMIKRQKQLMLITNNIGLPVNNIDGTYESVKQAWVSALETLEKVVQGMPHNINSGAVFLALISWHLYPDIVVIGSSVQKIAYQDKLIAPGGQITVGLRSSTSNSDDGLKWSLSLAHLRYYGDPMLVERSAGIDNSRVSFKQFALVILGSVFSRWGSSEDEAEPSQDDIVGAAEAIILLNDFIGTTKSRVPVAQTDERPKRKRKWEPDPLPDDGPDFQDICQESRRLLSSQSGWLGFLSSAAEDLLESGGLDRQIALRLVKLGARSGKNFLVSYGHHPGPLFGLTSMRTILGLMNGNDERIQFLRQYAKDLGLAEGQAVIRYSLSREYTRERFTAASDNGTKSMITAVSRDFGFATALPSRQSSATRTSGGQESAVLKHMRWIPQCAWPRVPYECETNGELFSFDHTSITLSNDFNYLQWLQAPQVFSGKDDDSSIQLITDADIERVKEILHEEWRALHLWEDGKIWLDTDAVLWKLPHSLRPAEEAANENIQIANSVFFEEAIGEEAKAEGQSPNVRAEGQSSNLRFHKNVTSTDFHFLEGNPSTAAIYILPGFRRCQEPLTIAEAETKSSLSRVATKIDTEQWNIDSATSSSSKQESRNARAESVASISFSEGESLGDSDNDQSEEVDEDDDDNNSHYVETNTDQKACLEMDIDSDDDTSLQEVEPLTQRTPLGFSAVMNLLKIQSVSTQLVFEYFALLCDDTGTWWDSTERTYVPEFRANVYSQFFTALRAISSASEVYKLLSGATVDLTVLSENLLNSKWIPQKYFSSDHGIFRGPQVSTFIPMTLSLRESFACLAMFETGTVNLEPDSLDTVMAMSAGDSLFVAAPLLCDPFEQPNRTEIRRIAGNVGRAGISMLVPPKDLRIAKQKISSWSHVTHEDFNGNAEDNFRSTSVHLSFTGYEVALSREHHGAQDAEVYYLESLLSVYDRGVWIADIDILSTMTDTRLVRNHTKCRGEGSESHRKSINDILVSKFSGKFRLTSIDNWQELLERPDNSMVIRSHGNWLARLAASAICIRHYGRTMVMPEQVCWRCLGKGVKSKKKQQFLGTEPWPDAFIY